MGLRSRVIGLVMAFGAVGVIAATATVTLQQGVDGYAGCSDRELRKPDSGTKDGGAPAAPDYQTVAWGG